MKQAIKRTIVAGAVTALLAAPAVVSAQAGGNAIGGNPGGGSGTSSGSGTSPNTGSGTSSAGAKDSARASGSTSTKVRTEQYEQQLQSRLEQQKSERQAAVQDKREDLKQRLDDAKRKACENHSSTINRLMNVMDKRRQNALDRITKISEAVQAFYDKKDLNAADYDDLVAQVNAAKSIAESATKDQQQVPSLDCSGEHPRADVADFKEKRATSVDAVKAYRDAVKELVKAVKTAAESSASVTAEGSASTRGNQ